MCALGELKQKEQKNAANLTPSALAAHLPQVPQCTPDPHVLQGKEAQRVSGLQTLQQKTLPRPSWHLSSKYIFCLSGFKSICIIPLIAVCNKMSDYKIEMREEINCQNPTLKSRVGQKLLYREKGQKKKKKSPHWNHPVPGVGARSLRAAVKIRKHFSSALKKENYGWETQGQEVNLFISGELKTFTPVTGWRCPKIVCWNAKPQYDCI